MWPFKKKTPPSPPSPSELEKVINAIVKDINLHPSYWKANDFTLKRLTGEEIWIANGKDYCRLWKPSIDIDDMEGLNNKLWDAYINWLSVGSQWEDRTQKINELFRHEISEADEAFPQKLINN